MKRIIIILSVLITGSTVGQESITLDECYKLMFQNYP